MKETFATFTFSSSSSRSNQDLNRSEEARLREFVAQLKMAKTSIQSTVTEMESLHCDNEPVFVSVCDARTADLEMAVLVQVRK
jgi:hypothetical protein